MLEAIARKWYLAAALHFSLSMPAYAQEVLPEIKPEQIACQSTRECFDAGREEFKQGQYERAGELFKRANMLAPPGKTKAVMLYNIGNICVLGNKIEQAVDYFQLYLGENVEQVQQEMATAPSRLEINTLIAGLRLYQESLSFFTKNQFSESIVMYQRAQQYFEQHPELALSTSLVTTLHLALGRAYDAAGKQAEAHRELNLYFTMAPPSAETPAVQKRLAELELILAPKTEEAPPVVILPPVTASPTPEKPFWRQYQWPLFGAGAAAALAGIGIGFNQAAAGEYQRLDDACARQGCSDEELGTLERQIQFRNVAYGVAITAAAASAGVFIWKYLHGTRAPATPKVQLNPNTVEVEF